MTRYAISFALAALLSSCATASTCEHSCQEVNERCSHEVDCAVCDDTQLEQPCKDCLLCADINTFCPLVEDYVGCEEACDQCLQN